ncbi:hypothetical protein [Gorillibacterium timonense]|uniref:hypothetical protein n=1 Tax=Gorillibacterium timonense TaxID=1689269 RepID=UPI00071C44AA|nr:hypothetical protein [Gorillibacterium timonense]
MYSDLMVKAGYWSNTTQEDVDAFFGRPNRSNSPVVKNVFEELAHEQITDKNGAKVTIALTPDELARRFFDLQFLLQRREKVYFSSHELSYEERQIALNVLTALFPDHDKETDK